MPDDTPRGEWITWSRHVLAELERLGSCYERLDSRVNDLQRDLAVLKAEFRIKSSLWGLLGGAVTAAIAIAIKLVS